VPVGQDVVVVGGGNAAIDAARTAMRLGARNVTIVYRRTRAEMPAYEEEVDAAEAEGVRLEVLAAPVEVLSQDGRVSGLKCKRMRLGEFDRSGRRRPVAGDDEFIIPADQVIAGIGQAMDVAKVLDGVPVRLRKDGFIDADPQTGQTSVEWLFAGGDSVLGPASVVEAIGGGERAAVAIDRLLTGQEHAFWRQTKPVDTFYDPEADPVMYPRARMQLLPVKKRRNNFQEVELPFAEAIARREAKRCLRCDYKGQCSTR
jgi:NADH-quinone oxidoreductase subunit F